MIIFCVRREKNVVGDNFLCVECVCFSKILRYLFIVLLKKKNIEKGIVSNEEECKRVVFIVNDKCEV